MISRRPWLERGFESDTPVEMFPNLLERLRGTPARVEDRLRAVSADALAATSGQSWSILENVGHLLQTEELWSARLDDFEARRETLTAARFQPSRVREARFNDRSPGDLCAAFRAARGRLIDRLERLDEETLRAAAMHPRLARRMRVVDLMVFIAEHDDHHLVTITQLLHAART